MSEAGREISRDGLSARLALVLRAWPMMIAARVTLMRVDFAKIWPRVEERAEALEAAWAARDEKAPRPAPSPEALVWAVGAASRLTPGSRCLARAIVGRKLMAAYGYRTRLKIGVAKGPGGGLDSHAWLELEGRPVIGDCPDLARFAPMPPWD